MHFDSIGMVIPSNQSLIPIPEHLNWEFLPEISLAEVPFHRVHWAQYISVFL